MNEQENLKSDTTEQDNLRENSALCVEDHLRIFDPTSNKIIVNTRG